MYTLSTPSLARLRDIFLQCREFQDINSLRSVFVTTELLPFRAGLRNADSSSGLVNLFIEYILVQKRSGGQPILPLFIEALKERYEIGDSLRDELEKLRIHVEGLYVAPKLPQVDRNLIFEFLMRLDFRSQISIVRSVIKNSIASAFLIHGPSDCGQRMLVHRLTHLNPKWESGRHIVVDAGSIGVGKSAHSLWREVAKRVEVSTYSPRESLIEKIQLWLLTQDVIMVVHTIDYLPEPVLYAWINDFWIPVARAAQTIEELKETPNRLILFLVDYQGKFLTSANELFSGPKKDAISNDVTPICLPPTGPFPKDEIDVWFEMVFDKIPSMLSVEEILNQTNNGIPELVYDKICEYFGISWEGELTP